MNEELKNKLRRYEEIKLEIKDLESEMKELNEEITANLEPEQVVETERGKFEIRMRANWKYSGKHESIKQQLKEIEAEERADGTAKLTESKVLFYTVKKD